MIKVTRKEAYELYKSFSRECKGQMYRKLGFSNSKSLVAHLTNDKFKDCPLSPDKQKAFAEFLEEYNISIDDYKYEKLDFCKIQNAIVKCQTLLEISDIEDKLDLLSLAAKMKRNEIEENR